MHVWYVRMMRQQNRELKNGLNSMLDIDKSSLLIRDKLERHASQGIKRKQIITEKNRKIPYSLRYTYLERWEIYLSRERRERKNYDENNSKKINFQYSQEMSSHRVKEPQEPNTIVKWK